MSFYETIEQYHTFDFETFFEQIHADDVERVLNKDQLTDLDFLTLLSPAAAGYLEPMARKAQRLTVQYFGRTIQLFIPLYISNFCSNQCVYCGFNCINAIDRRKLTLEQIEVEAQAISRMGMQHLLLLTGEAHEITPIGYLEDAVKLLKRYFASVSIEIFPMEEEGYRRLKNAGVDGLTLYQEVYDRRIYQDVHPAGQKANYRFRLDAPERGARAGFRAINLGPLIGLGEPRREIFFCGLHARYLDDRYLDAELGMSLPRFNTAECSYTPQYRADDRLFVQMLVALRLFMPRATLTISTRESAALRDHLIPLGVTRFSAGSCTGVGGYAQPAPEKTLQFEISDQRSVAQVVQSIIDKGYQPIYKDWDDIA